MVNSLYLLLVVRIGSANRELGFGACDIVQLLVVVAPSAGASRLISHENATSGELCTNFRKYLVSHRRCIFLGTVWLHPPAFEEVAT